MNEISTLVTSRPDRSLTVADRVARGLGWFSLGLGLAEIIAPGKLGRALNLEGKETLLRAYGGREIGAGVWARPTRPRPPCGRASPATWSISVRLPRAFAAPTTPNAARLHRARGGGGDHPRRPADGDELTSETSEQRRYRARL